MNPDLIFDVGVNRGEDTAFYLAKGYRVVGIEANPDLYSAAEEQFEGFLKAGQLQLLNAAVAAMDGPITFY